MYFPAVDSFVRWLIAPLAIAFLLSGLDDAAIDFAWIYAWLADRLTLPRRALRRPPDAPPVPIAILVPLWKEHAVITRMLEHNLAAIRYPDYHIFAGIYANDAQTEDAVAAVSERYPNVHLAVCPHDGPTSKADCLNWIYQHVGLYEEQNDISFAIIVTHDAEDMIHPEELRWVNAYAVHYDFIQIPVLALATPFWSFTHGVYCDEFAEYHTRDMVVRSRFGCFVPGSGVGTGYRREALEGLARVSANRVFEPEALTEDYESGLRLYRLGCRQVFVPLTRLRRWSNDFVATREFFPQSWGTALRQRTRWVTGIALQGWERFGWAGSTSEIYWLWRDRKGLIGSPLGVVANAVFFYGLFTAMWTRLTPLDTALTSATLSLQVWRMAIRMSCVARVYGPRFALGVPLRALYANVLNAAATLEAVAVYAAAKFEGRPLRWMKTEHAYPSRAALIENKQKLGAVLVWCQYLAPEDLAIALAAKPAGVRLGDFLVEQRKITVADLYEALSLQQNVPYGKPRPETISRPVTRSLPAEVAKRWKVLPYKVAAGHLFVAGSELPSDAMHDDLRKFSSLEIRFHLVTPTEFEELAQEYLPQ